MGGENGGLASPQCLQDTRLTLKVSDEYLAGTTLKTLIISHLRKIQPNLIFLLGCNSKYILVNGALNSVRTFKIRQF